MPCDGCLLQDDNTRAWSGTKEARGTLIKSRFVCFPLTESPREVSAVTWTIAFIEISDLDIILKILENQIGSCPANSIHQSKNGIDFEMIHQ